MNESFYGLTNELVKKFQSRGSLFQWQQEVLNLEGVLNGNRNLIYAGPTSSGKTLVSEILIARRTAEGKKVIVVFPFVAIAREKYFAFREIFQNTKIRIGLFAGGNHPTGGIEKNDILVCTIEKANSIVNYLKMTKIFDSLGAIFLDEIHLLGESGRGFILELLCTKAMTWGNIQIVGMSATIPNLSQIAGWLKAIEFQTDFRPIPLEINLCFKNQLWEVSGARLKRLTSVEIPIDIGKDPPKDPEQYAILSLLLQTIIQGHQAMVFCPTKDWCEKMVKTLVEQTALIPNRSDVFQSKIFEEFREVLIEARIWPDTSMYLNVKQGICFHHAGLTTDERSVVEEGFRAGVVRILMATTTLSAGVNLPARLVVVRSPYGFKKELIKARVFQQMCGRAGRKGIDDAGHAVLMCPNVPSAQKDARQLISNKAEMILSQLDRTQIQRAILEQIATTDKLTVTVEEIEEFISSTLYHHQLEDLSGRDQLIEDTFGWLKENEFIIIKEESDIEITKLGEAAVGAGMPPVTALSVFDDLSSASRSLNLTTDLHLVYLCTPIQETNLNFSTVASMFDILEPAALDVANKCQVDVKLVKKIARHGMPRKMDKLGNRKLQIISRFYRALGIFDLINEIPIEIVSSKYQVPRGTLQSLQISASQYAGMITIFCEKLGWAHLRNLLATFQNQIEAGVHRELLDLVRCPFISARRARQFYKLGYKRLKNIVKADISEIVEAFKQMESFISSKPQTGENELPKEKVESRGMVVLQGLNKPLLFIEAAQMLQKEIFAIIGTETILDEPESDEHSRFQTQNSFDNMSSINATAKSIACDATISPVCSRKSQTKADTIIDAAFSDSKSLLDASHPTIQSHLPEIDDLVSSQFVPDPNDASMMESLNDSLAPLYSGLPRSEHSSLSSTDESEDNESQELFSASKKGRDEQSSLKKCQSETNLNSSLKRRRLSTYGSEHSDTLFVEEPPGSTKGAKSPPDSQESSPKKMKVDRDFANKQSEDPTSTDSTPPLTEKGSSQDSLASLDESIDKFLKSDVWDDCTKPATTIISQIVKNSRKEDEIDSDETFAEPLTDDLKSSENVINVIIRDQESDSSERMGNLGQTFSQSLNIEEIECKSSAYVNDQVRNIVTKAETAAGGNLAKNTFVHPASVKDLDIAKRSGLNLKSKSEEKTLKADEDLETFSESLPPEAFDSTVTAGIDKTSPAQTIKSTEYNKNPSGENEPTFNESLPEAFTSVVKIETKAPSKINPTSSTSQSQENEMTDPTVNKELPMPVSNEGPTTPDSKSKVKKMNTPQKSMLRMDTVLKSLSPKQKDNLATLKMPKQSPKRTLFQDSHSSPKKMFISPKPPPSDEEDETQDSKADNSKSQMRSVASKEEMSRLKKYISKHQTIAIFITSEKVFLCTPQSSTKLVYELSKNHEDASELLQAAKLIVCWNFIYAKRALKEIGVKTTTVFFDVRQAICFEDSSAAIEKTENAISMKDYAMKHNFIRKNERKALDNGEPRLTLSVLRRCYLGVKKILEDRNLENKFIAEMEHAEIIFQMSENGMPFSESASEKTIKSLSTLMDRLAIKMKKHAPKGMKRDSLNFNHLLDQRKYVYDFLKCQPLEGKVSLSVSKEVLEVLEEKEPRIRNLIEFRRAQKAFSDLLTYKNASRDDRIYSTPVLINRTGRISMDNPSLQMVQNEFECCGKIIKVRNCFRANPKKIFISVDYRQLELRVLALLSGDEGLRASFIDHEDPFVSIGRKWLKRERISVAQRTQVKGLVYGVIYGMGNKTLSTTLGVSIEEAKNISSEFMSSYPGMQKFLVDVDKSASSNLYTETVIGRRRSFDNYTSRAARVAVNTKIQGSAADIVKIGTVRAARKIKETGINAKLVLQIHDELLFEVEESQKGLLEDILKKVLPLENEYAVRFDVKVKKGLSWDRLK